MQFYYLVVARTSVNTFQFMWLISLMVPSYRLIPHLNIIITSFLCCPLTSLCILHKRRPLVTSFIRSYPLCGSNSNLACESLQLRVLYWFNQAAFGKQNTPYCSSLTLFLNTYIFLIVFGKMRMLPSVCYFCTFSFFHIYIFLSDVRIFFLFFG